MLPYIIGVLLLAVGVFFFLQSQGGAKKASDTTTSTAETADSEGAANGAEDAAKREEQLKEIVVPGNMPEIAIYFGSQTGTAEKLANALADEATTIGAKAEVIDFNAFKEDSFTTQKLVFICVATHYEGDPCDNTRNFYKWFKKTLKAAADKPFGGMNFTIFGLGDTSYEQYNEMGKQFDEGFEKLGATRLYDMGVGNAETFSTETDFAKWKEALWTTICGHYAKSATDEDKKAGLKRRASLVNATGDKNALPWIIDTELSGEPVADPQYDMNMRNYLSSVDLPVSAVEELRQKPGDGASTLKVSFDLKSTGLSYITGANSAIYPTNIEAHVTKFAAQHGLDLNQTFVFKANPAYSGRAAKMPFPTGDKGITVKEALTKFIDLTSGPLSLKVLEALIPCCESAADKATLQEATKKDSTSYKEIFINGCIGLLDLKELLPSITIKPEVLFQKCDKIMPRYYTIASSSSMHPTELQIAVSLSTFDVQVNGQKTKREGLISRNLNDYWKSDKTQSYSIRGFTKGSNFVMPESPETPLIMVGPGTGVVPFIGFMQERETLRAKEQAIGEGHLYFGCRVKDSDFIYRDYMSDMSDKGIIQSLNLAFSRPEEEGAVKQYVQDVLKNNAEQVRRVLVEQNGEMFVCGATRMGKDVENVLKEILGADAVKNLQNEKRYKVELWSS